MLNLEQGITEWREQMLAAGIKSPATLDELESHLREEIQQQVKSGLNDEEAFNSAIQKVGRGSLLKQEFKKAGSLVSWLDWNKDAQINHVLGLLWLVYCAGSFYKLTSGMSSGIHLATLQLTPLFLFAILMDLIYLRGLIASVLLFSGFRRERRIIMLIAILNALGGVVVLAQRPFQLRVLFFTLLGFITIWLLRPPQKSKRAAN